MPSPAKDQDMRPPKLGKERPRTRGVRRQQLAFKPDADVEQYVKNEAKIEGWTVTTVVNDMLSTQKSLEQALGEKWWEIEGRAVAERRGKGEILAELVLAGLKEKRR